MGGAGRGEGGRAGGLRAGGMKCERGTGTFVWGHMREEGGGMLIGVVCGSDLYVFFCF